MSGKSEAVKGINQYAHHEESDQQVCSRLWTVNFFIRVTGENSTNRMDVTRSRKESSSCCTVKQLAGRASGIGFKMAEAKMID